MNIDEFKAALEANIDKKTMEIMSGKPEGKQFLTYFDAITLTTTVRGVFKTRLRVVPPQVEAACKLSEAVLAPSAKEREDLIKAAAGVAGGAVGIAMIIGGIGAALGWGAGMIAAATAFFVGSSMAGPIGWIVAGVTVAAIAGYFVLSSNEQSKSEGFLRALKLSLGQAVDAVWVQYEADLSK